MQNLYRHFNDDGVLLYVGVSLNAINRLCQHKQSHWFESIARVEIEKFPDRKAVLEAERKAIREENPAYNLRRYPKKKPKDQINQADKSRSELISRVVEFKPMYTVQEAAEAINLSVLLLRRLMDDNKIGFVRIGTRKGKWGEIAVLRITGWQLIDFIEQLESGKVRL